ncbi:unnamed protein product [Hermetia illucens]|uniref:Mpv17-like protein n=1 Tax=Hermetia illucens TaxID=343691 RepID=A0A7R8V1T7_HERIL|nr:mpv17-like protein [Hermetia illucens]CAD7090084.1 unnamed protein product [Hermetia illucens]
MSSISLKLTNLRAFLSKRPLVKGMVAYTVLWPTSSLVQQTIEGKTWNTYDWKRCFRFAVFGGLFVAPTLYGWVRFTSVMWPRTNLKTAISKALVDQVSYGPFAISSFYVGMSLLELKSFDESIQECKNKFFPTWKVAALVWPVLQTINFSLIPEGNRVVFVSICSVLWTTFLAYMKRLDKLKQEQ